MLAKDGPMSATDICEQFRVSPPAISPAPENPARGRAGSDGKTAQQRIYQLNPDGMHELEDWAGQLLQLWDERFDALDALLEREKKESIPNSKPKG